MKAKIACQTSIYGFSKPTASKQVSRQASKQASKKASGKEKEL